MKDCGKRFGPRRRICVRPAGHWGKHSVIRSARDIGVRLRRNPTDAEVIGHVLGEQYSEDVEAVIEDLIGDDRPAEKPSSPPMEQI